MDAIRRNVVDVQAATDDDIAIIQALWEREGERNVDVRSLAAVEAAISSGGLHTFKIEGALIATGGFYTYNSGLYTELGSSCWSSSYRGRGGADVSVCFRAVLASLYEPGTVVTSELYSSSVKSARVLARCGAEPLFKATPAMHEHAYQANPIDPVNHYVLPPWQLPTCARRLLGWLDQDRGSPSAELVYEFSGEYNLDHDAMRAAIERLASGSMDVIGHDQTEPSNIGEWLGAYTGTKLLTYAEFLELNQLSSMTDAQRHGLTDHGLQSPIR